MISLLAGLATGMSLLVSIGLQNAFVIKQGLRQEHIFWIALICSLSDLLLESLGVLGFGTILSQMSGLILASKWLGALLMIFYALQHIRSLFRSESMAESEEKTSSLRATILLLLGFTWLNPNVYVDTVLLLGSISVHYQRPFFLIGSVSASVIWFFALGYGASLLSPVFKSSLAWKVLDAVIAVLMLIIAFNLIF